MEPRDLCGGLLNDNLAVVGVNDSDIIIVYYKL